MSKKKKGVVFDPSACEDVRARFKHQTLVQDYIELQQDRRQRPAQDAEDETELDGGGDEPHTL
ncbi:hypothetical protein HanXRQr2_Chr06g0255121 [Helianthus annuus]|uniref:Uncharacterized protein n=1 Tax=Helianthus annuus TaxID=4232 RepID=A0A9K3IS64_HELAN|nr:hypothetical protein HanXRQr2_Chr06g0255121 [Helianthus annuus]KAJ0915113.1 hypothetical protein HanPSC8_Chr06g0246211 [Helianthus annuus]